MENFGEGLYMLEMGDFYNQAISLVCPFFAIRCSTTYKVSMSPYHWRSPLLVADCNSGPVSWPLLVLVVQPSVCPGCWRRVLSSEESADLPDNSELDYLIGLLGSFVINIKSTFSPLHALLVQLRLRKHKPLTTSLYCGGEEKGWGGVQTFGGLIQVYQANVSPPPKDATSPITLSLFLLNFTIQISLIIYQATSPKWSINLWQNINRVSLVEMENKLFFKSSVRPRRSCRTWVLVHLKPHRYVQLHR